MVERLDAWTAVSNPAGGLGRSVGWKELREMDFGSLRGFKTGMLILVYDDVVVVEHDCRRGRID